MSRFCFFSKKKKLFLRGDDEVKEREKREGHTHNTPFAFKTSRARHSAAAAGKRALHSRRKLPTSP